MTTQENSKPAFRRLQMSNIPTDHYQYNNEEKAAKLESESVLNELKSHIQEVE